MYLSCLACPVHQYRATFPVRPWCAPGPMCLWYIIEGNFQLIFHHYQGWNNGHGSPTGVKLPHLHVLFPVAKVKKLVEEPPWNRDEKEEGSSSPLSQLHIVRLSSFTDQPGGQPNKFVHHMLSTARQRVCFQTAEISFLSPNVASISHLYWNYGQFQLFRSLSSLECWDYKFSIVNY